jgi:hypothetical protein
VSRRTRIQTPSPRITRIPEDLGRGMFELPQPGRTRVNPPTSSGAIVMALGIFSVAALPRLPFTASLTGAAAAIVSVAWLAIAGAFAVSVWSHGLHSRWIEPIVDSFGIGTWVASTAVLARVLMLAEPANPWPARMAFAVSVLLWLWFMPRAVANLFRLTRAHLRPSGIILLSTVATQAVALIALRLFPSSLVVGTAAAALMALGAGSYGLGSFLVVRGYVRGGWQLATDWANGNCILHGALSITGLTAMVSGRFGATTILYYWATVILVFGVVEAIEIARLAARMSMAGWRAAILVYDVSQWARNFTFGMLYAFTLAFAHRYPIVPDHPALDSLRDFVLAYGAYAVLVLLVAETALMLGARPAHE